MAYTSEAAIKRELFFVTDFTAGKWATLDYGTLVTDVDDEINGVIASVEDTPLTVSVPLLNTIARKLGGAYALDRVLSGQGPQEMGRRQELYNEAWALLNRIVSRELTVSDQGERAGVAVTRQYDRNVVNMQNEAYWQQPQPKTGTKVFEIPLE